MDYPNNNREPRKNKYLNFEERMLIQHRLKDGFTYNISKELKRPINTISNEIKLATTTQIRQENTFKYTLQILVKLYIKSIA